MTPSCFCGCGRNIPRFPLGIKAINTRGRQVSERLAYAQGCLQDQVDQSWESEGLAIIETLRALMHRDIDRGQFDSILDGSAVRRWQAYGREMEPLLIQSGYPPLNTWLKVTGET